jgi:hypothetical protein
MQAHPLLLLKLPPPQKLQRQKRQRPNKSLHHLIKLFKDIHHGI